MKSFPWKRVTLATLLISAPTGWWLSELWDRTWPGAVPWPGALASGLVGGMVGILTILTARDQNGW